MIDLADLQRSYVMLERVVHFPLLRKSHGDVEMA
jgi:hypothetical protein